ncbi:MAG: right-handed parallel beta-helix repeat-containing protein [Bacteroidales bacterium]|nr:right-handed parallel beta-helix repeat-containing protein [Bacteroidales bacterium]
MKKVTTVILIFLLAFSAISQTVISGGDIEGTWTSDGNPYLIEGNMVIEPGERLDIDPGVKIVFTGPYIIEVFGRLDATGTPNDSITFTTSDTSGFATNSYNGWSGMVFYGPTNTPNDFSYLKYCNVEYSSLSGVACFTYSNLKISHSTIRKNKFSGINLMDVSDISVDNSIISNNGGEGINVSFSSPMVNDFIVKGNGGSGIKISGSSNSAQQPTFTNGTISNNHAAFSGGGINVDMDAGAILENVSVKGNTATNGGGIYSSFGYVQVRNCEITGNYAQSGGGIFCSNYSTLAMAHVLVSNNHANQYGGGIYVYNAETTLDHITSAANSASEMGGSMFFDLLPNFENTITNSISYQNFPDEIIAFGSDPVIRYSNVSGGFSGIGNKDKDPKFADLIKGNFKLSWPGFPNDTREMSPCIDSGDPTSQTDPDGTISDMGYTYFHQSNGIFLSDSKQPQASIYPNPARNVVYIENIGDDAKEVSIYNLSGQKLKNRSGIGLHKFNISDIETGLYIIRIEKKNGSSETHKLMIE